MANETNAQAGAQDKLQVNPGVSAPVLQVNHEGDVPWMAMRSLGQEADALGGQLGQMAAQASARTGVAVASRDLAAGTAQPKEYGPASNDAYNQTVMAGLVEQRKADLIGQLQSAEIAHPNDVQGFQTAVQAIGQAQADNPLPAAFADGNAQLRNWFTIQTAASTSRVQQGQEAARVSNGRAAMLAAFQTGTNVMGQAVDGAPFDAAGATTVAAAQGQFIDSLSKYGPRIPFDLAGKHYAADPTRLQVASPAEIEESARAAIEQSRVSWIYNAAEKLPSSAAQAQFRDQVEQGFRNGDPTFQSISGPQMDALERRLRMLVVHTASDERGQLEVQTKQANDLIEAYRWSGDPTVVPSMVRAAEATGDPGLIAKAHTLAQANAAMPGVLEEVARGVRDWNTPPGLPAKLATRDDIGNLVSALVGAEASPNGSVSPKGALGLTQIMPATGERMAAKLGLQWDPERARTDPVYARALTTEYVTELAQQFNGSTHLVTAAYNAGPGAVADWLSGQNHVWVDDHGVHHQTNPHHVQLPDPSVSPEAAQAFGAGIPFGETKAYLARAERSSPQFVAWTGARKGFAEDPLDYAHTQGAATVPALDPNGAFSPDGQGQFGAALQARFATGQALAQRFGVPQRMFTNADRATLEQAIKDDPTKAVTLAQVARSSLGPQGAHMMLKELGQSSDGPEMHIADLAAMGGPSASFAQTAAEGLRLKASGAKVSVEPYVRGHTFDQAQQALGPAFENMPDVIGAARKTAELARLADGSKGVDREAPYYLQSALGGTTRGGVRFGGVTEVNGRQTVLPFWLKTDEAPAAAQAIVSSLTTRGWGPVYSNGQHMSPEAAASMQLVANPDGTYALLNPKTNSVVRGQDGSPFRLDLERNRKWLSDRLGPGVVVPGP